MNIELSAKENEIKELVSLFARQEIVPLVEKIDREDWWPPDLFRKLGNLNLLGIVVPQEFGGAGGNLMMELLATEELAKVSPSVAISFSAHVNLCIDNLVRNGNEEQKGRFLPGLCRGNLVGGMAITEPSAGSDALGMQTTATRSGSRYLLNGSKIFTTNAPIADIIIVYAKTDISRGARGITAFIVETGTTGFKVKRSLDKIGIRGAPSAEIGFDNCEVEAFNILIGENQGLQVMMNGLDFERAVLSSAWLGTAQGAFDLALKYSKERIQFGQAISNFQLIQAKLADMYTLIQASRLFVYWVVRRAEAGMNVSRDAAAANLMSGEMCVRVAEEAVQIHGGYGLLLENPVQRYYRDAKLATIGGGTAEIRRLVVARDLLR